MSDESMTPGRALFERTQEIGYLTGVTTWSKRWPDLTSEHRESWERRAQQAAESWRLIRSMRPEELAHATPYHDGEPGMLEAERQRRADWKLTYNAALTALVPLDTPQHIRARLDASTSINEHRSIAADTLHDACVRAADRAHGTVPRGEP